VRQIAYDGPIRGSASTQRYVREALECPQAFRPLRMHTRPPDRIAVQIDVRRSRRLPEAWKGRAQRRAFLSRRRTSVVKRRSLVEHGYGARATFPEVAVLNSLSASS
jgi:hypothetical protein